MGDAASSIVWQTLMLFLANFYTDTFGISSSVTGIIYIVVLSADAFIDIGVGLLTDRTSTRWGKYRPYLLFAGIPFGVCAVLIFYSPPFSHQAKIIYAFASFLMMMIAYSFINVPYSSLSSVLTPDPDERTTLMGYRFTGAYTGGFIVQAFMLALVVHLGKGNQTEGYLYTMILLGSICVLLFTGTFLLTKERVTNTGTTSIRQDMKDLSKNKPWLLLCLISMLMLTFFTVRNIIIKYYFDYYIQQKEITLPILNLRWQMLSAFYVSGVLAIIVAILFTGMLSRRLGKKRLFIISNILTIISLSVFYFVKPGHTAWMFALQSIYCLCVGPIVPLLWSMYTDSVDYSEWKNGRRATGLVTAASLFSNKMGFAIGSMLTMVFLSFSGYIPNAIQQPSTIEMMKRLISFYPACGALIMLICISFYRLNERKMEIISGALGRKRNHT